MAHPNEAVVRNMFDAYERGDDVALRRYLAEDVVYYIPGRGPQGGEHRGRDKVITLWNRQKELMGGQPYHAEFQDSVATDKHVFGYVHVRAGIKGTEKGTTWSSVNVYRIRDGQIAEARPHVHDLYAFDEFWSALEARAGVTETR